MDKVLNHLKNNGIIYLILLACLIVVLVIKFGPEEKVKQPEVDTSMFKVVDIDGVMDLFKDKSPKMLLISVHDCTATVNYVPTLQISEAKFGYVSYYLELTEVDTNKESFKEFLDELDTFEYTFQGQHGTLKTFLGNTPLTLFIKDNKIVYGYYGSMSDTVLETFVKKYGVNTRD